MFYNLIGSYFFNKFVHACMVVLNLQTILLCPYFLRVLL